MAIDCHAHWIPPDLAKALRNRLAVPRIVQRQSGEWFETYQVSRPFGPDLGDIEARRAFLRSHGIRRQVLSLVGLFGVDCLPVEECFPLLQTFNDATADVQRTWPETFVGLAALPLADMPLACRELQRACDAGLRGAILPADGFRTLTAAERFAPLFEVGERKACTFFIHPGPVTPPMQATVRDSTTDHAWYRRIVLEAQASLSEAWVTLNFSDYLEPFPCVSVHIANLGGTMPFLMERMDAVARERSAHDPLPSQQAMRCYVDTASFGPRAIQSAIACFGPDRVVFGTDCPIFDTACVLESVRHADLDPAIRAMVFDRNAKRLYRIED